LNLRDRPTVERVTFKKKKKKLLKELSNPDADRKENLIRTNKERKASLS